MKLAKYSKTKPLTVVVKRKRWYRGRACGSKLLRSSDNTMCCLGFACRQIGVPRSLILNVGSPGMIGLLTVSKRFRIPGLTTKADKVNTPTCRALMRRNDNVDIGDEQRESEITRLGKSIGLKFKFVG